MERSIERADAEDALHGGVNGGDMADLIAELERIRAGMLALEATYDQTLPTIPDAHRASARNLIHYLALRGYDLRPLQARLARQGLSSLGRSEARVLATVDAVLGILDLPADARPRSRRSAFAPASRCSRATPGSCQVTRGQGYQPAG